MRNFGRTRPQRSSPGRLTTFTSTSESYYGEYILHNNKPQDPSPKCPPHTCTYAVQSRRYIYMTQNSTRARVLLVLAEFLRSHIIRATESPLIHIIIDGWCLMMRFGVCILVVVGLYVDFTNQQHSNLVNDFWSRESSPFRPCGRTEKIYSYFIIS